MLKVRKSAERGLANHGWLKSLHTFSFADYYDPQFMGFRNLRVINEDRINGGSGFGMHGHRDMEIISYVVKGELEHRDSKGNVAVIRPGEVQRMSAGTGVMHSEYNKLPNDETHFFQIWVMPNKSGVDFSYGQKSFANELQTQDLVLVISNSGREGSISIHQDVDLYISRLPSNKNLTFRLAPQRHAWLQVISGQVTVNDVTLMAGDAVAASEEAQLLIKAHEASEFLLFDLA